MSEASSLAFFFGVWATVSGMCDIRLELALSVVSSVILRYRGIPVCTQARQRLNGAPKWTVLCALAYRQRHPGARV
jgi:hypothetical protein